MGTLVRQKIFVDFERLQWTSHLSDTPPGAPTRGTEPEIRAFGHWLGKWPVFRTLGPVVR